MLERKRASKTYHAVPGDEETGGGGDVELNEGMGPQEVGITASGQTEGNMDAELDNWDENIPDPDEMEDMEAGQTNGNVDKTDTKPPLPVGEVERKKRDD